MNGGRRSMVWAFDVDGTLIGSIRSGILRPGARALLDALTDRGVVCVLWSAGGADHARTMAQRHGLADRCTAYYDKAERDEAGRYRIDHLPVEHRPDWYVDDSPIDLPLGVNVLAVPQFFGSNHADGALTALLADLDRYLAAGGEG